MTTIATAIDGGITYLRRLQRQDGSFTGDSSPTIQPFTPAYTYNTTFLPAVLLGALQGIAAARPINDPLAAWLAAQCSPAGSFNYWAIDAPERQTMPYPDDLDDTFCALGALYANNPASVNAGMLGAAVKLLVTAEEQVGGPYHTWLVGKNAPETWKDVDLAVNCNIAYFLRQVAEPLPNLTALMDGAIAKHAFTSPYYPAELPVLYYMARAYTGAHTQELTAYIRSRRPSTALGMALRICALQQLGAGDGLQAAIQKLMAQQQPDGSWPAAAFCLDAKRARAKYYHGSAALTTAFALAALNSYDARRPAKPLAAQTTSSDAYAQVITVAKANVHIADGELQDACIAMIDHMAAGDVSQEIVHMPQLFESSLNKPSGLDAATLQQLCLGSLFGWLAYTIFDDFLDEEGKPPLLPVATVALRRAIEAFITATPGGGFPALVHDTFDTIDAANAWETAHCRFALCDGVITIGRLPTYDNLHRIAERSYGHMLAPLAITGAAGFPLDSPQATHIKTAMHNYLIARQLQDDLYDWEADIRAGRITMVVTELIRAARLKPGEHTLAALLPRMQRQFWQLVLPVLCTRTERHLAKARKAAQQSGMLQAASPIYKLFDRVENMMHQTRAEQTKTADFLQAYKKPLV